MAQTNQNDFSSVALTTPANAGISPLQLPIRGEKRFVPNYQNLTSLQNQFNANAKKTGRPESTSPQIQTEDFSISADDRTALNLYEYIQIRIPHRGFTNGKPNANQDGVFTFLVNPETMTVGHTTVDAQSMTREGWQFGVWGEDMVQISLTGQTAGQYFSAGLTDAYQPFAESYRNLTQLVMVYENNGYWFEGEELGEGPLATDDFTRRRIKMHQDVDLVVGNFFWSGMFDALTVSQDAEKPFLANFTITFIAWKERFRPGSPWLNSIHNDLERGHTYTQYQNANQQQTEAQSSPPAVTPGQPAAGYTLGQTTSSSGVSPSTASLPSSGSTSPAVPPASSSSSYVTANCVSSNTSSSDQSPTLDIFDPLSPTSIFASCN
jgi:hypothetical protein